jgi:hypothetical protein
VRVDLCESDKINDILVVIQDQHVSAMHKARTPSWVSDMRYCVIIPDAEALGWRRSLQSPCLF